MAGDWLKIECSTPDKPEVFLIAERLGFNDSDSVVGKLLRVWIWADQQTEDGNAPSVTKALLDRVAGAPGFADAMIETGWLRPAKTGFVFPNFDRHNGRTAKNRAQTAKRVARSKSKKGNAKVTVDALPREEKRRDISTPRFTSEDKEVAEWMWKLILEMQPDRKPKAGQEENWPNTIRLLREKDQRTHDEIRDLFKRANSDPFWRTNILSPRKLREKWDDLSLKLKPSTKPAQPLQHDRRPDE